MNRGNAMMSIIALAMAMTMLAPVVFANPITPSLNWSPTTIPAGSTTTATVNCFTDPDCPSGGSYSGTITVTGPGGVSGTFAVGTTGCGTPVSAVFPTDFTGTVSTTNVGVYHATFSGKTSVGAIFSVTDTFTVVPFEHPAPEFPLPAMLVAALGMVVLAAMRTKFMKI